MLFLEASAKTKLGIRQVFMEVVKKMLENPQVTHNAIPGQPRLHLQHNTMSGPHNSLDDDDGGCC
jgi:Ras-related protein Rab-18